jgi:hypothetical protein
MPRPPYLPQRLRSAAPDQSRQGLPGTRLAALLTLTAAMLVLPGCQILGFIAQPFDGERRETVEAQYNDLKNKRIGVMVSASDETLFQYPRARGALTKALSGQIADNVEGVSIMNPDKIINYQVTNQYWHSLPYSDVIEALDVERLIVVDLVNYQTHAPGNPHIYQGLIAANVGVLEAEAENPDNFALRKQIRARYPTDSKVGVVNADEQTVELGIIKRFTAKAAGLFYEHKEVK